MHAENTQLLIESSRAHHADPLGDCVRRAIEVGVVVPSLLRANLKEAGYVVDADQDSHAKDGYRRFKNLTRVLVRDGTGNVVAMGASSDEADALLHACLGYLRERDIEKFGFILPLEVHRATKITAFRDASGREFPEEFTEKVKAHLAGKK